MTHSKHEPLLRDVFGYHERSKHHFGRSAPGPGLLDWSTQPHPFLRYRTAPLLGLDLVPPTAEPRYQAAFVTGHVEPHALDRRSLSQLFADSLALSAWKRAGETSWALRINPSSGNLHPTEGYVVCGAIDKFCDRPMVGHYAAKEHAFERRCEFDMDTWRGLTTGFPESTIFVGLTSIHWREAWKYGERAYRYCQHDVGHAIAALAMAAAGLGWQMTLLDDLGTEEIARLLGVFGAQGPEAEVADCLLAVHAQGTPVPGRMPSDVIHRFPHFVWIGEPERLSPDHVTWPDLKRVSEATTKPPTTPSTTSELTPTPPCPRPPTLPLDDEALDDEALGLREVIFRRRSAVAFDGRTGLTREGFFQVLQKVSANPPPFPFNALPWRPRIDLAFFVHRVRDLDPGLYLLVRDKSRRPRLQAAMMPEFAWKLVDDSPTDPDLGLYLLQRGDARELSAQISCQQEIAADGCFSLGMIADFEAPIRAAGPWIYPRLFWECGVIGQVLYLEAEALGLRGTGIGCFFDNPMQGVLGLSGPSFQSLYHFTVGGSVVDTRLQTLPAYDSPCQASPLSAFKLRLAASHARLRFADGTHADLEGPALDPALRAAAPLIRYLEQACDSPPRAISVDFVTRVLRVTYEARAQVAALRIDGSRFDDDVVSRCSDVSTMFVAATGRDV